MLNMLDVNAFYGRSHALHQLCLEVPTNSITTIVGRNGVGKTTLLKILMGLMSRVGGIIRLGAEDITRLPAYRRARAGIAYVPKGGEIIADFTVRENILMGAFARKDRRRVIPDLVPVLFPYLMQNLDRPGGVLSGGQQQQLAIARALAADPRVLLLDEPTGGIQPNIVEEIESIIIRLNKEAGMTVVLVEQNVAFARRAGHHFMMMEKGRIVAEGDMAELTDAVVHRHRAV